MTSDDLMHLSVVLGVLGFGTAAWLLVDPPGCVRRYQAARRRRADRGFVEIRGGAGHLDT